MRKALPAYEDLKKTLWWEFQPDTPYLNDGCYHIGLLVYLRFLLSLPGPLEPEQRRKQIGETEESLKEGFESQRYPMNILGDFISNLHRIDPNEALRIFVDKFASIFVVLYVRMGATTRKLGGEEQIRYIDSVRS